MGSDERRGGIDDDQHLLTRIAEGDQTALRALVVAYRPRLWRYLGTQLGDCPELIEEVLQDVFVAVWRAAAGFRGEARVATWLYRLAHHHAANARRSASRHGVASYLDDADEGDERSPLITASHDDAVAERLDLHAALRSLPVKQREAIELVFVQGFSCEEAGRIVGAPTGTIKSRLSHGRRALSAFLMGSTRLESPSNG